ncbi:MAG: hypothetical protein ACYTEZ_16035 [Planctomycetota bacterium]
MRRVLFAVVCVECVVLIAGAAFHLGGGLERYARRPPSGPVFRPPIHEAVIGDFVRYERRDRESQEVLGYLDYEVELAIERQGTHLGREFVVKLTRTDARGKGRKQRKMRLRPRAVGHGYLPPRFEEDDAYPQGARPVVKTIRPAPVPFRKGEVAGFLVEAVVPRESLTEIKERFWITDAVPLFGVARWERDGEVLVVLRQEKLGP